MRFYTGQHQHYCGIDLHARTLYLCILDAEGNVLLQKNLPCDRQIFRESTDLFLERGGHMPRTAAFLWTGKRHGG
jgi:hypothetical protein